jgi:pimeloyl-ACP methyl ester carboxylesterase
MTNTIVKDGYVSVNGLEMYYEIHGSGQPLVLVHGAFSGIGTSFGALIPELAKARKVIGFELQAHGRTADIDRPLSLTTMADDVAGAIQELGFESADLFGYSMGAGVALRVAIHHPEVIRKLILASVTYTFSGIQPGLMEGLGNMKPEMMYGSPWHDEYMRIAPHPENFSKLFAKKTEMDRQTQDLVRPEHAVEMFRLLGGGVFGDTPAGLPDSQLAVLPGTSHVSLASRTELLIPMINSFLDKPMPAVS